MINNNRKNERKRKNFKTVIAGFTAAAVAVGSGGFAFPVTAFAEETPYWTLTREVEGAEQTITHAVLNSNGELVMIGAEAGGLDGRNLEPGTMAAQKFGAFEDMEDAENGIVKLTFDVVGSPVNIPGPLDVIIIADESGSLNMYGRAERGGLGEYDNSGPRFIRDGASYMPCLNKDHAYLVGDLQKELYEIALLRLNKEAGTIDPALQAAVADALAKEPAEQEAALAAILAEETNAVAVAEAALKEAQTALADAEDIHKPFQGNVDLAQEALDLAQEALDAALMDLAEEQAALDAAKSDDAAAQADLETKQAALADANTALQTAQTALNDAQAALDAAKNTQEIPEAAAAVEEAQTALAETVDLEALQAAVAAAEQTKAAAEQAVEDAKAAEIAAKWTKAEAADALQKAQDAYDTAYAADEDVMAAADALQKAQAAYDAAVQEAEPTKQAVADAQAVVARAEQALADANAALTAKKAQMEVLLKVKEIEGKLAASAYDVYINPHDAGLEYATFGSWKNNVPAVRKMIEEAVLADGTPANVVIPDILTEDDVYLALLSDWDDIGWSQKGFLTFTVNGVTKTRKGWDPDTNHCYFKDGKYVLIPQPENTDMVVEENALYSYWSPAYDNPYGCVDRMIIEKEGVVALAEKVLDADPNNRVAYVGFTYQGYPSLSSFGLGDNGFCGNAKAHEADLAKMKTIMANTNGHDYTNYVDAMYMARKIISMRNDQSRPCYVVFISDGMPTRAKVATMITGSESWNILTAEDYPWFDDVYYQSDTHAEAAEKMAGYLKGFMKEVTGEDIGFYTVGFNTNSAASAVLESMATDTNAFFNCQTVAEFMDDMKVVQQEIMTCYPSGTLTDKIGEDFDLLIDDSHPFVIDGTRYTTQAEAEADERVMFAAADGTDNAWDVSAKLQQVDEDGVRISFYVQLNEEELNKFEDDTYRVYDTNADSDTATGANLDYGKLIPDHTKSVGYYTEPLHISMETPQVRIVNGEVIIPDNTEENNNSTSSSGGSSRREEEEDGMVLGAEDILEPEVPLAGAPEEDGMVLGAEDEEEEDGMVAGIADTGDSKAIIFAGAGMLAAAAGIFALRKKED